jgi:hypothetical protein
MRKKADEGFWNGRRTVPPVFGMEGGIFAFRVVDGSGSLQT